MPNGAQIELQKWAYKKKGILKKTLNVPGDFSYMLLVILILILMSMHQKKHSKIVLEFILVEEGKEETIQLG